MISSAATNPGPAHEVGDPIHHAVSSRDEWDIRATREPLPPISYLSPHSQAAPLTPLESPCFACNTGVLQLLPNTYRGRSFGTLA